MRIRSIMLLTAASSMLMAGSCPTSDPFIGAHVKAPYFSSMELTGIKSSDAIRIAVHIQWKLPGRDTCPVREFVILRKKDAADSVFTVMHFGIPDSISDDYDILLANEIPDQGVYGKIWYKIFTIDTSGNSGDTSDADSIRICWPPRFGYPADTLQKNEFKWYTIQYMAGYFTYMYLWNADGSLKWTSNKPSEPSYGHESLDSFSTYLPDSMYPLTSGNYWYGLKVEIPGENIQSLTIQGFYAP
jgi:hypothetical protein